MKKLLPAILWLCIALPSLAQAQSGYILNSEGQRMEGDIRSSSGDVAYSSVEFRPRGSDQWVEYSASDIQEYGWQEAIFVSKSVRFPGSGSQVVFLQRLFEGRGNLYQYGANAPTFLFETETLPIIPLNREGDMNYQGQLDVFLDECVSSDVYAVNYSAESLLALFQEFNACNQR